MYNCSYCRIDNREKKHLTSLAYDMTCKSH